MSANKTTARKIQYGIVSAAAIMLSAQLSTAAVSVLNNTTQSFTAINGTLGDALTMGTNGHVVLNGIGTDTVSVFTGQFNAGGTPNRGTANVLVNANAASNTVLNLGSANNGYNFTPNKTDILIEGINMGGTGVNSTQVKWGDGVTGFPPLFGAAAGITGYNATILVHELTTGDYNMATYDAATGVRGLSTSNPNDYVVNAFTPASNILLNNSQILNSAANINSLTLKSAGGSVSITGSGSIVLPSVGAGAGANGILSAGPNANTISVPITSNATDGLTVHTVADLTINGDINSAWITKANAGVLTLTGTNVIPAANFVSIDGGVLSVSSNNNLGTNNGTLVVLLGGSLRVTQNATIAHPLSTYEGDTSLNVIEITAGKIVDFTAGIATRGSGGVTYAGPGTTVISAVANTGGLTPYTGPTKINGGTLVANVNGAITAATSVAGGAKFQINTGMVVTTTTATAATVTMSAANSELAAGSTGDTGTAGLTGALVASSGATLDFDINGTVNPTDLLNISGTVTAAGTFTVNLNDLNGASVVTGTPYTVLTGGTFTGTPTLVGNLVSSHFILDPGYDGDGLKWDTAAKTLTVQFAAVPEPASLALLAFGGLGLLVRRRRSN